MELLDSLSGLAAFFGTTEWHNFASGAGDVLTGIAAVAAIFWGRKEWRRHLLLDAMRLRMESFREANNHSAKGAASVMYKANELVSNNEEHLIATQERLAPYLSLADEMNEASTGACEYSQTLTHLLAHCLRQYKKSLKDNKSLPLERVSVLVQAVAEEVHRASANAAVPPTQVKFDPVKKTPLRFRNRIRMGVTRKIRGMDQSINGDPFYIANIYFCQLQQRLINIPELESELFQLLRSNETLALLLKANFFYAPLVIQDPSDDNPLGLKRNLWLVKFEKQIRLPGNVPIVNLFYMEQDTRYRFIQHVKDVGVLKEKFIDKNRRLSLATLFCDATFSKNDARVIKLTLSQKQLRKNYFFALLSWVKR